MLEESTSMVPMDRFGNPIDEKVGYARGQILHSSASEIARTQHSRGVIRDRINRLGEGSCFDLSGLPRAFPLKVEDLPKLRCLYARKCTSSQGDDVP